MGVGTEGIPNSSGPAHTRLPAHPASSLVRRATVEQSTYQAKWDGEAGA